MYYKVRVTQANRNKRTARKRWYIVCALCKVRSHTRMHNWDKALEVANRHAYGKQHTNKLNLLKGTL